MNAWRLKFLLCTLIVTGLWGQPSGIGQVRVDTTFVSQVVEELFQALPGQASARHTARALFEPQADSLFQSFKPVFFEGHASDNWLKLTIDNVTDIREKLYIGTSRFEYIDCWIRIDTTVTGPFKSGQKLPLDLKSVDIPGLSFFEFDLPAGKQAAVLLHCVNRDAVITPQQVVPFTLMNESTYDRYYEKPSDYTYMFIGAAIIMGFFNLMVFFITGVRAYLFYTAYVIFVALFVLALVPQFAISLYGHMDVNRVPISLAGTAGQIFYVLVGRNILETKTYYPRIDKLLKFTITAQCISLVLELIPVTKDLTVFINYPATLINYPSLMVLGLLMTLRRHIPSTYFFVGTAIYGSAVIIMIFQLLQILPPVWHGLTAGIIMEIGVAAELALFSLGLGARINMMRRRLAEEALDKERLKREQEEERKRVLEQQNRLLEEKVQERTKELQLERDKSEELLLNILPAEVAAELKSTGRATPKGFQQISIAFIDFVAFTKVTRQLSPEALVALVDHYFGHFDTIVEKYDMEKIKTIGDAYFMVSGLPVERPTHAFEMMQACQEIMAFCAREKEVRDPLGLPWFDCRIGIHSGSVIAGIVGHKKYAYDVWGRDVNIASRIESNGIDGRINLSKATYDLLKDRFPLEHHGTFLAKNIGELELYCLKSN
ncbi:MAG: hypothetical protein H6574_09330 [Lewinellaceae bacterium]|nr:hypothetical protein [Saprospiraceae bacterium]MCB9317192.1 hypothetical protein [Lewinellaceae bacterium]MCB9331270.1 hypothetical protein [Lewinellaceae bacterium]